MAGSSSSSKQARRISAVGSTRGLRIALIAGVAANVVLAAMLLMHTFLVEPSEEFSLHMRLVAVSVLAVAMSMLIAVVAWRYVHREDAARRIEEAEKLFRVRADDAPLMLWMTDVNNNCIFANRAWQRFVGQSEAEILGDGWVTPIHPDEAEMAHKDFEERTAKREPVSIEYRVKRHDGVYRWILDAGYPRYNITSGEYEGYSGGCIDVTERRQATDELRQWFVAMEQSMDGVARLDTQGRYELVSQQYAKYVGRTVDNLIGTVWDVTVHPDDMPHLRAAYDAMVRTGRVEAEARGVRGDGSVFFKRVAMVARRDANGALLGHYCFMKDITQERVREEQASATGRKLEALTVSAPVPIFHMLPDGTCTYVNPQWGRVTGYAVERANGHGWVDTVHVDDREALQKAWNRAVQSGQDFEQLARLVRPSGEVRWIIARATAVADGRGGREYIGTLVDFTDVKEAELSLRESLRTQQQLLAREAGLRRELDHRVRNNLAGLLGLVHVYKQRGLPAKDLASVIEGKILVLKEVHELLAGTAGQPVGIADIVSRLVTRIAPAGRSSHIRFAGPRVTLSGMQAGAMAMIVQELLTNSIKHGAMSVDEGHIAITWTLASETPDRLFFDWVEMPLLEQPRVSEQPRESGIGLTIVEGLARAELRGACSYGPRLDGVDRAWTVSIEANVEPIDRSQAAWQQEAKSTHA